MAIKSYISNSNALIRLSFPIILAQLGNVLLGITDTIMLGQFGQVQLAAVGLANQLFFLVTVIGMGIMTALTPIIATSRGAENKKECGEFLRSGIELSLIISMIVFVILIFLSVNFDILHQSPLINRIAGKYLRIVAVSVFPMLLFLAMKHFNDGLSYTKPVVIITLIGVLLNLVLDWIFIFGKFTFPPMGAAGAAIATVITRIVMAMMLVVVIFRSDYVSHYLPPLVSTYKTQPIIKKLLKMGFPTGLQIFFEVAAYTTATILAGWVSLSALAAHQIGMGLIALSYMVATGLCVAGSIKVGHAFGKGNKEEIKVLGISSIGVSMLFMVITSLLLLIFRDKLLHIFTHEKDVINTSISVFMVFVVFQLLNGIQATTLGILRGIQDVSFPAVFTLFAYWMIAIPVGYLMVFRYHFDLKGVWIGMLCGLAISVGILCLRFFYNIKNDKIKNYKSEVLDAI
jgi:multidrug resistance protein, MATE family